MTVALPAVAEHPAVRAWGALGELAVPTSVEVIKEKRNSSVYRLLDAAGRGHHVIAKRRGPDGVAGLVVERQMYERVLPALDVDLLRCHGLADDDGSGWLFIEDAAAGPYIPMSARHRGAVGRWIGALHTAGTSAAGSMALPDRGPGVYLGYLRDGRATVEKHAGNLALTPEERDVLDHLLRLLALVEERWPEIVAMAARMPRVVVHGDLIPRNILVRPGPAGGVRAVPIDWEKAGWGLAVIDLAQAPIASDSFSANADVAEYVRAVCHVWPQLDRSSIEDSAWIATIFRSLAATHWDAPYLRVVWPHRTMAKLEYYRSALRIACERVGWDTSR